MEAPLCKLCGERHWSGVCPKFQRISPKEKLARAQALGEARRQEKAAAKAKKPNKTKRKAK